MLRALLLAAALLTVPAFDAAARSGLHAPYPSSSLIAGITWHANTYASGGPGGDIWASTSGADGSVYAAWGDGTIGCRRKVSYGVAALPAVPRADPHTVGCGPPGVGHGKIISLLDVHGTLDAVVLDREASWPYSPVEIWGSGDHGRTWRRPGWSFTGGDLRPQTFVTFGPGYGGSRDGFVYLTALRATKPLTRVYLARAPEGELGHQAAYQYLAGTDANGVPRWTDRPDGASAIFTDPNGVDGPQIAYDPGVGRYLLTIAHGHDGADGDRIGIFEAREPWGPWGTVQYEDGWLGIRGGTYLGLSFPSRWLADNGRTLWAVFSCYGARSCGRYHDKLNIMQATLTLRGR
jgi:hypothetical protein